MELWKGSLFNSKTTEAIICVTHLLLLSLKHRSVTIYMSPENICKDMSVNCQQRTTGNTSVNCHQRTSVKTGLSVVTGDVIMYMYATLLPNFRAYHQPQHHVAGHSCFQYLHRCHCL